jgi:hypothetical protein
MKTMVASAIKKNKLIRKSAPKALTIGTLAGLLAACNNDNDSVSVVTPTITSLSGAVVKGPLSGALVYADNDGDGIGDGDPITTASDGSYTITASNANATIIAMSGPNTIDTSSGEALTGITLKAPAGSTVVTPATTILEAQPEIEPAQLAIALGIPTTAADGSAINIMSFNPYAADADPAAALAAEKAAQQVMVTIKAVSAAAEGAGMNVEDAFEQAMASVASVVSVEAEKIDVSSTASIASAEATMATTKVDFSDSSVLDAVSTAVQTAVVAAAASDDTIVVDTTAFAAVLETAVTAVSNVNAAIEAITDTDLTSTESMGTFATLTDMATEIKAAAEAEVIAPGAGAALVSFTDAAAVTTAVAAAVVEVESYVEEVAAAAIVDAGGEAVVEEVVPVVEVEVAEPVAAAAPPDFDTSNYFVMTGFSGATWTGGTVADGVQDLTVTQSSGTIDVTSDVQVEADDFTSAFSNSSVATHNAALGHLSITNLTTPVEGSVNDGEVTITIKDQNSTDKIVAGFKLDWDISGSSYVISSDDTSLDVIYTRKDNSETAISILNTEINNETITIENDGSYGGNATINVNALYFIQQLEKTTTVLGKPVFSDLESRFAVAGKNLDVTVDVSNLNIYSSVTDSLVTTITSTIDIV